MDIKTFFSKFGREDFTRESYLYFILAISFVIVVLGALVFYLHYVIKGVAQPAVVEKSLVERQFQELDLLKEDPKPLTEEEIQDQVGDLNDLQKEKGISYNEEDTNNQFEELNKLRNSK